VETRAALLVERATAGIAPAGAAQSDILPHYDPVVQQIKDRINIVEIVGQYVTLRRAGRSYTGRCPFPQGAQPEFPP